MSIGGCLHCTSISRFGFLLSWVDRREWLDYGLCRGSSRPRLGMYSGAVSHRAISDVRAATCCSLSPNPGQWWRAGGWGEKIMVLLSQLNIFRSIRDTIPSPHTRPAPCTRVQNGLVIVSSVCNSIIIHTTWRTQGS